jgi:hypothetical protein
MTKNLNLEWLEQFVKSKIENITEDVYDFCQKNNISVEEWDWTGGYGLPFETGDPTDWFELSKSKTIDWSIDYISERKNFLHWPSLSWNTALPWSFEIIDMFKNDWSWDYLSSNDAINFDEKIINTYIDNWDWSRLSGNQSFPWTEININKFYNKIDWNRFCGNPKVNWTKEFIENHSDKITWHNFSKNIGINWSKDFVKKYSNQVSYNWVPEDIIYKFFFKDLDEHEIGSILSLEEFMFYEDRIDYENYYESNAYNMPTSYDNEFYDDERDLDQQHPDFDF